MASLYKRGKVWWIRYSAEGRQRFESLHTASKRVALKRLQECELALDTETFHSRTRLDVETFLERYYRHLEKSRPKKSFQNERNIIERFFDVVRVSRLEQVTKSIVTEYLQRQSEKGDWSPRTWNNYRSVLVVLFKYAIEYCDFRPDDPSHRNPALASPRKRKIPRHPIIYLARDDIRRQLDALKNHPQLQTMVAVLIFGGLRREEMTWLTKSDIGLDTGNIRICSKEVDGESWVAKTNSDRRVPISDDLRDFLKAYEPPAGQPRYFPSPLGGRWHPDAFSKALEKRQRRHKLGYMSNGTWKPYTCLHFRHTFATQLAARGTTLDRVAKLMGNSVVICERHYSAFCTDEMTEAVQMGIYGGPDRKGPGAMKTTTSGRVVHVHGA